MEVAIIAGIAVIVIAIVIAVNAKNKAAARENFNSVQSIVASFLSDYEAIKKVYIAHSDMQRLLHKYQGCYDSVKRIRIDKLDQDSSAQAKSFLDKYASFEKSVPSFNEAFIEAEKRCCTGLFSVDGKIVSGS